VLDVVYKVFRYVEVVNVRTALSHLQAGTDERIDNPDMQDEVTLGESHILNPGSVDVVEGLG
jgi:hypothetical protein